ncbi:MAG: chemotaxis protein CheW [Clostridiales bacterium]|nr:chemotaxis protein CheW [Clostridiales bacterium]MCF8021870.1 chemotaxis protein CheW [Clostridiales bacterium]
MVNEEQIVVFEINQQQYALPIYNVSEIIRVMEITPVPNTDYYVKGIINLRGSVVPVISLNLRIGMEEKELSDESRIIVMEQDNVKLGVTVDSVQSVTRYSESEIEIPESMAAQNHFIRGIIHRNDTMVLLLDLDKIMN